MTVAAVPKTSEKKPKEWYVRNAFPSEIAIAIVDENVRLEDVKKRQKQKAEAEGSTN